MPLRSLKWIGGLLLAVVLLIGIAIALFDWNWAKGPLERRVLDATGRQLVIGGDLKVKLGWPLAHVDAAQVTFANPSWARDKEMLAADHVAFTVDLWDLLFSRITVPTATLKRPRIALERSPDGRGSWRLDREQQAHNDDFRIGLLRLDHGVLNFDDGGEKTSIQAELSTAKSARSTEQDAASDAGLLFNIKGQYKGFPLTAQGGGGPALALGADTAPYPLKFEATLGRTRIKADGTITGLLKLNAIDLQLALKGDSLAQLLPQLGLALPETHAYALTGHLGHDDHTWRYEKFSGMIGRSDLAGTLQVDIGGPRAFLHGDLVSARLDFADLGPMVGTRQDAPQPEAPASAKETSQRTVHVGSAKSATPVATSGLRMLPSEPYNVEHWSSLDAEVAFSARKIHRAEELPLENLATTIRLRDSVMTLDPLDFGIAGGHLDGKITMDGRQDPIKAAARLHARNILLAKMLPTIKRAEQSIGQMNGEVDLAGTGNAVNGMLATANGKVAFVVGEGKVSKLLMETIGLHLPEIVTLKIGGDKIVGIRCGIADFNVRQGVMTANELVLDTEVTNIGGTGTIDLAQEKMNLTLVPETKNTSLVALRAPIHVRGSFGSPEIGIDAVRVAARGLGAVALGLVNPLLALVPLVEPGPGKDSDCSRLIKDAKVMPGKQVKPRQVAVMAAPSQVASVSP